MEAIAVFAVLAGDAVGNLMQMRLAHDHGAGLPQPSSHGGIGARDAVLGRIEAGAAGGRVALDIEAILNGDRNPEQRRPLLRLGKAGREGLCLRQRTVMIHRQIYVVAGIAVGVRQCVLRRQTRLC